MKSVREIFDLRHKKPFRFGFLLVSALFIGGATIIVYGKMVFQRPLNAGNAGSGPIAPGGIIFSPATILILAMSTFVIGLSIFGLLREVRKQVGKGPDELESLPADLESASLEEEAEEFFGKKDEFSESLSE